MGCRGVGSTTTCCHSNALIVKMIAGFLPLDNPSPGQFYRHWYFNEWYMKAWDFYRKTGLPLIQEYVCIKVYRRLFDWIYPFLNIDSMVEILIDTKSGQGEIPLNYSTALKCTCSCLRYAFNFSFTLNSHHTSRQTIHQIEG